MKNLILLLVICAGASASASVDLPAFAWVNDRVYRGGRPSDDGILQLRNLGIKTDINLQGGDVNWSDPAVVEFMSWWEPGETPENIAHERELVSEIGMSFVSAPLNAIAEVTREEDADIDRVLAIMGDPAAQPVYVHCEHGRDRTGLVIALYRVKYEGMTIEAAHEEWVDMGHSGIGKFLTGNLDKYFYAKAAALSAP